MDESRSKQLLELQKKMKYTFRNPELLVTSLTHKSYINENPLSGASDNERMEFLGDAVLGLCISDLLMKKYTDLDEGALSQIHAWLVREKPLADLPSAGPGRVPASGRARKTPAGARKNRCWPTP